MTQNAPRAGARIDGIFGLLTEEDVVDFQGDSGLKADGIAGPKTWDWRRLLARSGDSRSRSEGARP